MRFRGLKRRYGRRRRRTGRRRYRKGRRAGRTLRRPGNRLRVSQGTQWYNADGTWKDGITSGSAVTTLGAVTFRSEALPAPAATLFSGGLAFARATATVGTVGAGAHCFAGFYLMNDPRAIPNFARYSDLYDRYRPSAVKWTISPWVTQATTEGGAIGTNLIVHSYYDYDSNPQPASGSTIAVWQAFVETIKDRISYRRRALYTGGRVRPIKLLLKRGAFLKDVNGAQIQVARGVPWLKSTVTNVQFRGIGVVLEWFTTTSLTEGQAIDIPIRLDVRYYTKFRDLRPSGTA